MISRLAFRNIWRNKRRSIITITSVFFAVLLAVVMKSIQQGAWNNMQGSVINYYYGYLQVQHQDFRTDQTLNNSFRLSSSTEDILSNDERIDHWIPRVESFALVSYEKATKGTLILGIDPQKEKRLSNFEDRITSGHFFNDSNSKSVILAEGLFEYLGIQLGDTVVLITQGFQGSNAAAKYLVEGVVRLAAPELNNQVLYLPITEAQNFLRMEDRITSVVVQPHSKKVSHINAIRDGLDEAIEDPELTVLTWQTLMPELVQARAVDEAGSQLILYILYILIGFGIFGTIVMMLKEREYELGVLVSIGMKRKQLSLVLWLEIIFIGLIGTVLGCIGATPIVYYLEKNPIRFSGEMMEAYEKFGVIPVIPAQLDWRILLTQAWVIGIIVSIISIYPIYQLMRLNPIESMRKA